ncbi:MAG: hypothetical protein CMR00_02320 [[Chlorobium] sp. 445]|nr:MAG: hypothetical protein CMR00_02320 [[Chlorobium] sp. 445]
MLKKWLFIPDEHPDYTATLQEIYRLAQSADYRLGVMPKPKKPAKKSQQRRRLACRKSQRKV